MVLDPDGPDLPEPFVGDTIDAGALIAEFAALGIDPYPKSQVSSSTVTLKTRSRKRRSLPVCRAQRLEKGSMIPICARGWVVPSLKSGILTEFRWPAIRKGQV